MEVKMDALSRLNEYPHLLDQILISLNHSAVSTAESVSLPWKRMIHHHINVWKKKWNKNLALSSLWKILAARMEYCHPELFDEIKRGELSIYRQACDYMDQNVRAVLECHLENYPSYPGFRIFNNATFKVDERYVYIATGEGIMVINRWTRQLMKQLDFFDEKTLTDLQKSGQYLVVKSFIGGIVIIYDTETCMRIQTVSDHTEDFRFSSDFYLRWDCLVNATMSKDKRSLMINLRRLNPATGVFGPHIEKTTVIRLDSLCWGKEICFDEKYLVVDMDSEDFSARIIKVYDMESFELIRERTFAHSSNIVIKRECHDGVIVVLMGTDDTGRYLAAWNLENDLIQPIIEFSSPLFENGIQQSDDTPPTCQVYSGAVDYNSGYQFVVWDNRADHPQEYQFNIKPFRVPSRRSTDDCLPMTTRTTPLPWAHASYPFFDPRFYFDGIQCIFELDEKLEFMEFV